jgi:hypothetical protein
LILALDEANDLTIYENVEETLNKINEISKGDFKENIAVALLNFLKVSFVKQCGELTVEQIQEIAIKDSLLGLLKLSKVNSQFLEKLIMSGLVNLLADPHRLFAMLSIVELLISAEVHINTSITNLESSIFFSIYTLFDDYDFSSQKAKVAILVDNLDKLNLEQYAKLTAYVKEKLTDGFTSKTYPERLKNLIDSLMQQDGFRKIVGVASGNNTKQINSAFFGLNTLGEIQSVEIQLRKLNSLGDNRSLESHGADPYYWYSIGDGLRLLQAIRQEKLVYKKSKQQYPCKLSEELSCVRENIAGIFIADPYATQNFATALQEDIKSITKGCGDEPKPWNEMPRLLLFSVLTSNYWRVIRVQIDYKQKSVSILWDDPYGKGYFNETLQNSFLELLKVNIFLLFQEFYKKKPGDIQASQIAYSEYEKVIDQQGKGNEWDCGVIAFSNIYDYANADLSNKKLSNSKASEYTIGFAGDQQHNSLIAEIRRLHVEWFHSVEGSQPMVAIDDTLAKIVNIVKSDNHLIEKFSQLTYEKIDQIIQKIIVMQLEPDNSELIADIIQQAYDAVISQPSLEKTNSTASLISLQQ